MGLALVMQPTGIQKVAGVPPVSLQIPGQSQISSSSMVLQMRL